MVSEHFFHVLFFLVIVSFPFSSVAFHVVTPTKEFNVVHSNSLSSAPSLSSSNFNTINIEGNETDGTNFSSCFDKVYAFGDSYTDTGNAQLLRGLKNFVSGLLSNGQESSNSSFGQRSSNGWLVVDFLCDALNISSLPPYKSISESSAANLSSGVNFATAGATVFTSKFFAHYKINNTLMWQGTPQSFQTQIEWYNKYLSDIACKGKTEEGCKADMGNSLFWLGQIGINDYARVLGSTISLRWLKDITIAHTSKLLTTLLDRGAKYIVVQGLPPLGCYPFAKSSPNFVKDDMGCAADINRAVIAHNDLLQTILERFRRKQSGNCMILYADYFNAYKTITVNLGKFGFEDVLKACCGAGNGPFNFNIESLCGMLGTSACKNPDSHIHWDGIHLTEAMHRKISDLFLHKDFCKPSFSQLIKMKKGLLPTNCTNPLPLRPRLP
ncbi:hypothetical protein CRYUN_Cryun33cG0007500 [Craigia yunnanensis]